MKRQHKRALPPITAKLDIELCFNCMGDHLIKECRASKSVCPVRGCGEHHHVEAHKFIANRRMKRNMRMGSANRYPVRNSAGDRIAVYLLQSEIDRFSDQCILWQQDIVSQERGRSATANKTEESNVEESSNDEETHGDMSSFCDDAYFGCTAAVDGAIDSAETDEDVVPVDEDDPAGLLAQSHLHDVGPTLQLSDADPRQLLSLSTSVPATPEPCCTSWSNPLTWFGASLTFIGCMLGGSHAAITLDGASIVSEGLLTLPVADFASAQDGLRHTGRLVSSRCQESAWGAPPFDTSRSLLSPPYSSASGPKPLLPRSAWEEAPSHFRMTLRECTWDPRRGRLTGSKILTLLRHDRAETI